MKVAAITSPPEENPEKKKKKKLAQKRKKKFKDKTKKLMNGSAEDDTEKPKVVRMSSTSKNEDGKISVKIKTIHEQLSPRRSKSRDVSYKEVSTTSLTDTSDETDSNQEQPPSQPPNKKQKAGHHGPADRQYSLDSHQSSSYNLQKNVGGGLQDDSETDSDTELLTPKINLLPTKASPQPNPLKWKQHRASADRSNSQTDSPKNPANSKWRLSDHKFSNSADQPRKTKEILPPKLSSPQKPPPQKRASYSSGLEMSAETVNTFTSSQPPKPANPLPMSPQKWPTYDTPSSPGNNNPIKKAIGHSSSMSKHQKNMLSRVRGFGKPKKVNQPSPSTGANKTNVLKSPPPQIAANKKLSFDAAANQSPNHNVDNLENGRQNSTNAGRLNNVHKLIVCEWYCGIQPTAYRHTAHTIQSLTQ